MKHLLFLGHSLLLLTLCIHVDVYALKPDKTYIYTPDSFGLNYENHIIKVNDSTHLKAWKIIPAPAYDKKTTIILVNGDAGNMSYVVYHASSLVMKGYTVICFDYRGFGESSAFTINPNFLYYNEFAYDVSAVIQWSRLNMPAHRTGIWAFSMGTLLAAKSVQNNPVDFYIGEGMLFNPFVTAIRLKLTQNKDMLLPDSADRIPGYYAMIPCKMLLVSGNLDQICSTADCKKVCGMGKNRKLVTFKGGHMQGMEYFTKKTYGDLYIKMIDQFIGT